jgi:hypothetical protein
MGRIDVESKGCQLFGGPTPVGEAMLILAHGFKSSFQPRQLAHDVIPLAL